MQAASGRRPAMQSQATALDNLEELVGFLREISESWEAATRIADIFEKLLKEQRKAMLLGVNGGGLRKRASKKRRKLETLREDESAVHAAKEALAERSHAPVPLRSLPGLKSDDGSEMSSPATQPPSALHQRHASSSELQQTLFSPPVLTLPPVGVSPVFASPIGDASPIPPRHKESNQDSNDSNVLTSPDIQHFPGSNVPSYPTGYLSDDSYLSDAGSYNNMNDFSFFFANSTADTIASPSQMTSGFGSSADFNFLFNTDAEVNMDAVMPGLSLFDPTGLSSGVSGANTGHVSPSGYASNNAVEAGTDIYSGSFSSDVDLQSLMSASMAGRTDTDADIDLQAETRTHASGVANGTETMDEHTRALYDMLAALNYQQQF